VSGFSCGDACVWNDCTVTGQDYLCGSLESLLSLVPPFCLQMPVQYQSQVALPPSSSSSSSLSLSLSLHLLDTSLKASPLPVLHSTTCSTPLHHKSCSRFFYFFSPDSISSLSFSASLSVSLFLHFAPKR
jgi:hypothetical protein